MGPMNDDDNKVTRTAAEVPVTSEPQTEGRTITEPGDQEAGVEERLASSIEEAGYGYGV